MYQGFNLSFLKTLNNYYQDGQLQLAEHQTHIRKTLDQFVSPDGALDGAIMQSNWFPQINVDVFISHSHADTEKALSLAGWLKREFGLNSFVDSTVWGYADKLLWEVDHKYCRHPNTELFDYHKRNQSTGHIHMMLAMAIAMMIESTECLFFLNPNSLTIKDSVGKTESPWIYYEIGISNLIKKKSLREYRNESFIRAFSHLEGLDIKYPLNTKHLLNIDERTLNSWLSEWKEEKMIISGREKKHPLDILYSLTENK